MLIKLKFIGVKIKSVANNQDKVIEKVKKNSKKISDLKFCTNRQIEGFTNLFVNRIDSSMHMRGAKC